MVDLEFKELLKSLFNKDVFSIAKRISQSGNPSYLFMATRDGFYFGEVKEIIKRKGKIDLLEHPQIPKATQESFLKILNDFES